MHSSAEERLRTFIEEVAYSAPTKRFSASDLADIIGVGTDQLATPIAEMIVERVIEPVLESRCILCGQQPEEPVDPEALKLDCPDHGEQRAEHRQLFQITPAYRRELNLKESDPCTGGRSLDLMLQFDSRNGSEGPESNAIVHEIEKMHDTIKAGQAVPAPDGPAARAGVRWGKIGVWVAIVIGLPTLFFTAYPIIRGWFTSTVQSTAKQTVHRKDVHSPNHAIVVRQPPRPPQALRTPQQPSL